MQNKEQKNKPFSLKGLNKEQISGGAYSLSAVLPTLISLLFLIVITAAGLTEMIGEALAAGPDAYSAQRLRKLAEENEHAARELLEGVR